MVSLLEYGLLTWHFGKDKVNKLNSKCQNIYLTINHIKSPLWAALCPLCCLNIQMGWSSLSLWDSRCPLPGDCGRICAPPAPWRHHLRSQTKNIHSVKTQSNVILLQVSVSNHFRIVKICTECFTHWKWMRKFDWILILNDLLLS